MGNDCTHLQSGEVRSKLAETFRAPSTETISVLAPTLHNNLEQGLSPIATLTFPVCGTFEIASFQFLDCKTVDKCAEAERVSFFGVMLS